VYSRMGPGPSWANARAVLGMLSPFPPRSIFLPRVRLPPFPTYHPRPPTTRGVGSPCLGAPFFRPPPHRLSPFLIELRSLPSRVLPQALETSPSPPLPFFFGRLFHSFGHSVGSPPERGSHRPRPYLKSAAKRVSFSFFSLPNGPARQRSSRWSFDFSLKKPYASLLPHLSAFLNPCTV